MANLNPFHDQIDPQPDFSELELELIRNTIRSNAKEMAGIAARVESMEKMLKDIHTRLAAGDTTNRD